MVTKEPIGIYKSKPLLYRFVSHSCSIITIFSSEYLACVRVRGYKMFNVYDTFHFNNTRYCHVYATETGLRRIGCDKRGKAKWLWQSRKGCIDSDVVSGV